VVSCVQAGSRIVNYREGVVDTGPIEWNASKGKRPEEF